jgi:hypothetical protein
MVTRLPGGAFARAGLAAGLAASFLLIANEAVAEGPSAITAWTAVVVRVYDTTGLSRTSRQRAMSTAGAAMVTASVDVDWVDCSAMAPRCQVPPAPRDLVVRLVRGHSAPGGRPVPLGSALVDTGERAGALATVYVDRVQRIAATLGTDEAVLLGRAIAHELGHLLTGTNTHARVGLMRGHWTSEELRRDRGEDWIFR